MATCPECGAELGEDAHTCPEHVAPAPEPGLEPGAMVGEYRILKKLGAGTFGDVYAGEQPVIGKRVAVKVLNKRFASDPVVVSRFVAEARAVNKIRQRNIIDIFSFGTLPGVGRHYFVMEWLDGSTLGELLARVGRVPVALVLPIVRGIADGLDAAHETGITHRDLKPDNVFLARERDGTCLPKLLDFGIAKLLTDDVTHRTGSGMVLGTPRYMSPEQARGKPTDHRTDIYALGVMVHEMLTGTAVFDAESAVDMLLKHAVEEPPHISAVCPDLPRELDAPVLAMLAKRPDQRPASAGKAIAAFVACAKRLGLDEATMTLADLEADSRAAAEVRTRAQARAEASAERHVASTVTIGKPGRGGAPDATRPDPSGKTERAPVSEELGDTPEASLPPTRRAIGPSRGTMVSSGASDAVSGEVGVTSRSGPTTESVAALETPRAMRLRARGQRVKVVAGAVIAAALGLAVWAFARNGGEGRGLPHPVAASSAPPATPLPGSGPAVRAPSHPTEPEVVPVAHASATAPSPATSATEAEPPAKVAATADAGARAAAAPGPHGPAKPGPAKHGGKLDRILGDRD